MLSYRLIQQIIILVIILLITAYGVRAAVDLVSFTATAEQDSILIEWETATEIDNVGFYLTRNLLENCRWTLLYSIQIDTVPG